MRQFIIVQQRKKKAAIMQKCKYEYLHIVWTICALMASIMTLVFRRLWNDIRTILICWCTLWTSRVWSDHRNLQILFLPLGLPVWGLPSPSRILLSSNSANLHNNSFLWNLLETTNICRLNLSNPSKQPHVCCHFSWLWAHPFGLSC